MLKAGDAEVEVILQVALTGATAGTVARSAMSSFWRSTAARASRS